MSVPEGVPNGIWYSAFDRVRRRFYFSLAARSGIFTVSFDSVKIYSFFNETVELEYFVHGDDKKSFYGLAIDEKRRILYCADPIRGIIGVWSLEHPNVRKFMRAPQPIHKFQPAFISLSPLKFPSDGVEERLLAISDWNNDQIYIYKQRNVINSSRLLNVSHVYLGNIATALRPRPRSRPDARHLRSNHSMISIQAQPLAVRETKLGLVDGPLGTMFDAAHNLIVADYLNHRVQIFDGGRDDLVADEPLFRPSWASADLNTWVLTVATLIDNSGWGFSRARTEPVVMAGLGTGEVACFK